MFLAMVEVIFAIIVIWFIVTQIVIPLLMGTRSFPAFRPHTKKSVLQDMMLDEKDKIEEEELRHSLQELRRKEKEKSNG